MDGANFVGAWHLVCVDARNFLVRRQQEGGLHYRSRAGVGRGPVGFEERKVGTPVGVSHYCEFRAVGERGLLNGLWGRSSHSGLGGWW